MDTFEIWKKHFKFAIRIWMNQVAGTVKNNKSVQHIEIVRKGVPRGTIQQTYSRLMADSWMVFTLKVVLTFFLLNLLFAIGYFLIPDSINGLAGQDFLVSFNFSVQTFSTIGYGGLIPNGTASNLLVAVESLVGIAYLALLTGLLYSRFSRPIPSFQFSDKMIIREIDGKNVLQFRVMNTRGHELIDVRAQLNLLLFHTNSSGQRDARIYELELRRSHAPILMLNWVFEHVIDEESSLFELYDGEGFSEELTLYATVFALDGTIYQSVYLNQIYQVDDIACKHRFVDMIDSDGKRATIWTDRLHQIMRIKE